MKRTASVGASSRSSSRSSTNMKKSGKAKARFAVCIKNKGYEASLDIGKLYRIVPDREAKKRGYLRIIDESGSDYGYAADRFFAIAVPKPLEKALVRAVS